MVKDIHRTEGCVEMPSVLLQFPFTGLVHHIHRGCCLLMVPHSYPFLQRTDLGLGMFIAITSSQQFNWWERKKVAPYPQPFTSPASKLDQLCGIIQLQSPVWDQDKASLTFSENTPPNPVSNNPQLGLSWEPHLNSWSSVLLASMERGMCQLRESLNSWLKGFLAAGDEVRQHPRTYLLVV